MTSTRRRLSKPFASMVILIIAGTICWFGANYAVDFVEQRSRASVQASLLVEPGYDWVQVKTDGLQVVLSGMAPTEVARIQAATQAAKAVDARRIVNMASVERAEPIKAPHFRIELLRNGNDVSLIGLVPASTNRSALVQNLKNRSRSIQVSDLLQTAKFPAPDGWDRVLDYGLMSARLMPHAKISIEPGKVTIAALAESRAEKGRLETELKRGLPAGIELVTEISSPRPVIAPFSLQFLIDSDGARFDACSADNEIGRKKILDAAIRAGVTGKPGCALGLGAPTEDWAEAAVAGINSIAAMKQGTVSISNTDVTLTAPPGTDQSEFDTVKMNLEQALPDIFSLTAKIEQAPKVDVSPVEFTATMSSDRALTMSGRIADAQMREAVDSFAQARFASVDVSLDSDGETPEGWTVNLVAGLEALDTLANGNLMITPEAISLTGVSGDPQAAEVAASVLSKRLGAGAKYKLAIRYDRRLDEALSLPDGTECVDDLNNIISESAIGFEPSKAIIAGDPSETLQRFAGVMTNCSEFQIEVGGHTDSQGSEGFNAELSRGRAQSIVKAMVGVGIDGVNLSARGYGESQPIATNETEAGREENRRIEFRLMSVQPVQSEALPPPAIVEGVTREISDIEIPAPVMVLPMMDQTQHEAMPPADATAVTGRTGTAPATLGASEAVGPLGDAEEGDNVAVQIPDENTLRPKRRPGSDETGSAATGSEQGEAE